jgi:hypothetical protein
MNSSIQINVEEEAIAELPLRRMARHRGSIFVIALGVMAVLAALIVVYAQNMRTEAILAGNRISYIQADAIERAAEQYVLAECDMWGTTTANTASSSALVSAPGDAVDLMAEAGEAVPVGTGYFFLLQPAQENDQNYVFGICDESSKLNINSANANELLTLSSQITQDEADSIVAWRTSSTSTTIASDAMTEQYYDALLEPYDCKSAPFESVEELMLVEGITPTMMFGYDMNRDHVIETSEANNPLVTENLATGTDDRRGIFDYLTAYTTQTAAAAGGGARGGGGGGAKLGLVNINTAPELTLMALGLSQEDADTIINNRTGNPISTTGTNTMATFLASCSITSVPVATLTPLLTASSYQYSADILAVTGDGRGFKRVRIVIDSTTAPSKIIYRKDLTSLGFPLIPQLRQALREGVQLSEGQSGANDPTDQQFGAGR